MKTQLLLLSLLIAPALQAQNIIHADVQVTHLEPETSALAWQRVNLHTPKYPIELAQAGVRGCGVFKVQVDSKGNTESVELINAVPKKGLAKSARKLIKRWKWQPNTGKGAAQPDPEQPMLIRLDFCMGGESAEEATARCRVQAQYNCAE